MKDKFLREMEEKLKLYDEEITNSLLDNPKRNMELVKEITEIIHEIVNYITVTKKQGEDYQYRRTQIKRYGKKTMYFKIKVLFFSYKINVYYDKAHEAKKYEIRFNILMQRVEEQLIILHY